MLILFLPLVALAQKNERKDSLVRLLGCDKLQLEDIDGHTFRKALGNARFEHNSTKLLCDTALWNVDANMIEARGHVRIIQNKTVLSSDNLNYYIGSSMAEFRGSLVQLQDKDKNTLRTRHLEYYTQDSTAVFMNGGSFRDKDGQVIESVAGRYDSQLNTFRFSREVNMYTDSVFIKTDYLEYNTETAMAVFTSNTHAWRGDNMLSSSGGSYDRKAEVFTFTKNVHLLTRAQEAWADTLVYDRAFNNAEMFGNVELLDTTRNVAAVAGYMEYIDSLERIRMLRDPSVIGVFEQDSGKDTVYFRGDEIRYWTVPKCEVPAHELSKAESRLGDLRVDPIMEYRKKAYEAAKAAAEEARKKMEAEDPNLAASRKRGGPRFDPPPLLQVPDSLNIAKPDSLSTAAADSLAAATDSTKIGFLLAMRNVKVFRKDMQVVCDSLAYTDLDSLVRLYKAPIVWNEIRRQYSADSITVAMKNNSLDKASLMSNAFIVIQEDSLCFDQIKGAEMTAYFDSTGVLKRFDSMGGASGLFFLEEKGSFATVNKFEAKMLTASFANGSINDLNYFEAVKSDAYPVVQLRKDERVLKGFEWQPEKRPKTPEDVVKYTPRKSQRAKYERIPRAKFPKTELYFPGHIDNINKMLFTADSLKRVRRAEREAQEQLRKEAEALAAMEAARDTVQTNVGDTLQVAAPKDSLAVPGNNIVVPKDSLAVPGNDIPAPRDSVAARSDTLDAAAAAKTLADSLKTARVDSLRRALAQGLDAEKELKKAQREAKKALQDSLRQVKVAKKEAKWAALDAKDAERAAKKAEKEAKKQEVKLRKMLKAKQEREAREEKLINRYKARYEKKKARQDEAALKKKKGKDK